MIMKKYFSTQKPCNVIHLILSQPLLSSLQRTWNVTKDVSDVICIL